MDKKDKKIKILNKEINKTIFVLGVIGIIAVISVTGYFIYSSYATDQYDNSLKKAYSDEKILKQKIDTHNNIVDKVKNKKMNPREGMEKILDVDKEMIKLIDNQTKNLKEGEQFAMSDNDKKYLNLLIKNRESLKESYNLDENIIEEYIAVSNNNSDVMGLGDLIVITNRIDKRDDKTLEVEKSYDNIKGFLEETPDFKARLVELGISNTFLGEYQTWR